MRHVAFLLGWEQANAAEKIRRRLLRIEQRDGVQFLRRVGSPGRGTRYFVTMAMLRKYVPDMFSEKEERLAEVEAAFRSVNEQLDEATRRCFRKCEEIERTIRTIRARLAAVERATAGKRGSA